jgi:hypothetical protein
MRHQGKQRIAAATPRPREKELPTSGYALVVDGHSKAIFTSNDQALKCSQRPEGAFSDASGQGL